MDLEIAKKIKVMAFDFDGVIVDSNHVKRNAWFEIFPESLGISNEEIQDILDFKSGDTRFVILREIFSRKGVSDGEEMERLIHEYAQKFDERVQIGIVFMPEVKEVLPRLASHAILYMNSATPTEPLRRIVKKLEISHYFKDIFGNPGTRNTDSKKVNLQLILESEKIIPEEMLFIGDHEIDYNAAKAVQCRFIGVPNEFNGWRDVDFPLVERFSMLEQYIL